MSAVLVLDDHVWRSHHDPSFSVAGLVLTALTVDENGYRHYHTGQLVMALLDLAADDDRDGLRDWLLAPSRTIPDSTLAEVLIYVVETLTDRRWAIARTLVAMALADWHNWRGRFLLRGIKPNDLSLVDVVDALYALLWEDAERRGVKPVEITGLLDQMLADQWLDRELWGTDVATEAMMVAAPELPRRT